MHLNRNGLKSLTLYSQRSGKSLMNSANVFEALAMAPELFQTFYATDVILLIRVVGSYAVLKLWVLTPASKSIIQNMNFQSFPQPLVELGRKVFNLYP